MKIAIINTYDIQGGAARAAYRLHKGLLQQGADSRMVVLHKKSDDPTVVAASCDSMSPDDQFFIEMTQKNYISNNRTDVSNTLFSLPYTSCDISMIPEVRDADVINLHWVAQYQSPFTLKKLFDLGKPVVWTMHDQWAFTGGCHYSAGCERYRNDCLPCPQLSEDRFHLPSHVLKDKVDIFNGANITIVTPSAWMGSCARQSILFKDTRVEVIPNGLETDIFIPISKSEAKKQFSIHEDTVVLLAGAETSLEKRKGFQQMQEALSFCKANPDFQRLIDEKRVVLMCFGYANNDLADIGLPVMSLGHIDSDYKLRDIYSAADIFILPSLEDNLPNTMVESLSCGTPVVAFQIGGIPEVVMQGVNGQLVPAYDARLMAKSILALVLDQSLRRRMGQEARLLIAEQYSQGLQAKRYLALFNQLKTAHSSTKEESSSLMSITKDGHPHPHVRERFPYAETPIANATLQALKDEVVDLQHKLVTSETDNKLKAATIFSQGQSIKLHQFEAQSLHNEIVFIKNDLLNYQKHLEASELDRAARLDAINSLLQQKAYLESFNGAAKVVLRKILVKLHLLNFAKRHKNTLKRLYGIIRKTNVPNKSTALETTTEPAVAINSPLVEAFISARSLGGELDEKVLVAMYELGSQFKKILCIQPGEGTVQALTMLSKAGAHITCCGLNTNALLGKSLGFTIANGTFASWLTEKGSAALINFDLVIADQMANADEVNMLRGRIQPGTGLLFNRVLLDQINTEITTRQPEQLIGSFALYKTPPDAWIDPLPKEITAYDMDTWSLKAPRIAHPFALPSGRAWPKISIVTVTYNQGHYLEETIRSVLLQGYPNLEYIIIDGGSTDSTAAILKRYRGEVTHCISEKDKGQSDALNKGFRLATGDILAWLNSDDRYYPWSLWRVAQFFDAFGCDILAGGCALVQGDQKLPFRTHHTSMPFGKLVPLPLTRLLDIDGSWQKGDFFYQPEVFWSRDLWERSGAHIAEKLYYSMDYELWLRMARSKASILHIPDTLALFRMHDNQKTSGDAPFLPELRRVSAEFRRQLK